MLKICKNKKTPKHLVQCASLIDTLQLAKEATPSDDTRLTLERQLAMFDPKRHGGEQMRVTQILGTEHWQRLASRFWMSASPTQKVTNKK